MPASVPFATYADPMALQAPVPTDDEAPDLATAARIDARPRWRRMLGIGVVAGAAIASCGYVWAVDPNAPGHYPLCPTRALLGLDCPGCGGLRGMHDLLHGNVGGALDHNVALAVLIPAAVIMWGAWARRAWTGRIPPVSRRTFRWRTRAAIAALVLLLVFGVVRNFVPYLGSGA